MKNASRSFGTDLPPFISARVALAHSTRDLVRQRGELAQSKAVDAGDLEDRLK